MQKSAAHAPLRYNWAIRPQAEKDRPHPDEGRGRLRDERQAASAWRLAGRDQIMIALVPSSAGIKAALTGWASAGSSRLIERNSRPASLVRFQAAPSSTVPGAPSRTTR